MRVELAKCDGCGATIGQEDEARGRLFSLRTPFQTIDLDICRECWHKMAKATPQPLRVD